MRHAEDMGLTLEQTQAIGEVAIESTYLDMYVNEIISDFCVTDEKIRSILMGNMQTRRRLDVLHQLVQIGCKNKNLLAEFEGLFSQLQSVNSDRNTVIHGRWLKVNSRLAVVRVQGDSFGKKSIKAEAIQEVVERLNSLSNTLMNWYERWLETT